MTDKTCALHDSLTAQGKVVVYKGDKYFKLVYKIEKIAISEIKYKSLTDLYSLNGTRTFGRVLTMLVHIGPSKKKKTKALKLITTKPDVIED